MTTHISRREFLGAAAVLSAATLVGCSDPTNAPAQSAERVVNVYLGGKPKIWSPLAPGAAADQQVMSFIWHSLVQADNNEDLQPMLCESYDVSPDATTFTFHLREGLEWSDGTPFTSKDVMFTYTTYADPKSTNAASAVYKVIQGVEELIAGTATTVSGFEAPDDHTFIIKTVEPNYGLLMQLSSHWILPEHILGADPIETVAQNPFFMNPNVSMGPYVFVQYKTDQYVELKANPSYFRHDVQIDKVFLKPLTSDVAVAQLGTGEVDIASISATDLPTVEEQDDVEVTTIKGIVLQRLVVNQAQPYFADVRVRQALLYGIDRQGIVDTVLGGQGTVPNSILGPAWTPDDVEPYAYDPDKATQLLTEAGWDFSRTIVLMNIPGSRDKDQAATILQDQLGQIGVQVELANVQGAEMAEGYTNKTYDMLIGGAGAADPWLNYGITGCDQQYPAGGNIGYGCDPEFDALMKEANATADEAERTELYAEAARQDNLTISYPLLYNAYSIWAHNTRVQDFQAKDGAFWDPGAWKVSE